MWRNEQKCAKIDKIESMVAKAVIIGGKPAL
jgi:hypothetical protein